MDVKVGSCLVNTLSCLDVREIQKRGGRADLVQLFVFLSNLAEKCVIVRPQLVHMVRLYFTPGSSITKIQTKCKGVHSKHIPQLSITVFARI